MMYEECEECKIYGDDYRWDNEEQDYISCCDDCIFNEDCDEYISE